LIGIVTLFLSLRARSRPRGARDAGVLAAGAEESLESRAYRVFCKLRLPAASP